MKVIVENIVEVIRTEGNKLLLVVDKGDSSYQHIYREALGVYWNSEKNGFESTTIKEWGVRKWYDHILNTVKSGLGIELVLSHDVHFSGLANAEIRELLTAPDLSDYFDL